VDWQAAERGFDEALLADGVARPHYENVVAQLELLGREELARREEMAKRTASNGSFLSTLSRGSSMPTSGRR
jgi:uncharacterized circularly permuted ATP-grasp superfamily protein